LRVDEPFIRQTGIGNEQFHTDALGSTLALSNATGVIATSYSYEAFGKATITGVSSNPFQFAGRENDGTGLYYYRARYLSPSSTRFIGEDPILAPMNPFAIGLCKLTNDTVWLLPSRLLQPGLENGSKLLNGYAYTSNNPLGFVDPTGLEKKQRKEECQKAVDDCANALQREGFGRPQDNGRMVSDCYRAGMASATAYGGINQASQNTWMEYCSRGTPYHSINWPLPDDCQLKTFANKCTTQ
jgi:RHS repeat-associated protein